MKLFKFTMAKDPYEKTRPTLQYNNALAFNLILYILDLSTLVFSFSLKQIIVKIFNNFCLRSCNLLIPVNMTKNCIKNNLPEFAKS